MKAELPEFIYDKCQAYGLLHTGYSKESILSFLTNIVHLKVDEVYERYRPSQPQQPSVNDQFHLSEGNGYSSSVGTTIHAASIDHTGNRLIFREALQLDNLLGGRSDHNVNHVQGSSIPTNNPGSQFTTNYNRAPESSTTQSVPFPSTTFNGADHSTITDTQDNFNTLYQPNAMSGNFYGSGQMSMNMEQGMGHEHPLPHQTCLQS